MELIKKCIQCNNKIKKFRSYDSYQVLVCGKCKIIFCFRIPYGKKYNYCEFENIWYNKITVQNNGKISYADEEISNLNAKISLQESIVILNKTLKNLEFV